MFLGQPIPHWKFANAITCKVIAKLRLIGSLKGRGRAWPPRLMVSCMNNREMRSMARLLSQLASLAIGAGAVLLPTQGAIASPCDDYSGSYYCYIWLPGVKMSLSSRVALAALSGQSPLVVLVTPLNGSRYVVASTPIGRAEGLYTGGVGNLELSNGVKCYGRDVVSSYYGRPVRYGICTY